MKRTFTWQYWPGDSWYVGKLKEVPCVFSQGETLQELERNIREVYRSILEILPRLSVKTREKI